MAITFDGSSDYLSSSTAYLDGSAGPFTIVVGLFKPTNLTQSACDWLLSGDPAGDHWGLKWESVANSVSFTATGYTGTDPATSSDVALDATDVADGCVLIYRYMGASGEWAVWKATRTGGITKTVISASVTFILPSSLSAATYIGGHGSSKCAATIAEVSLLGYAVPDDHIEWLARGVTASSIANGAGLLAYWPLRGTNLAGGFDYDYVDISVSGFASSWMIPSGSPARATHPTTYGPDYVPSPEAAWALEIQNPVGTLYAATRDLAEPLDVDTLGTEYPQRIINGDSVVVSRSIVDGIASPGSTTVVLSNDKLLTPYDLKKPNASDGLLLWLEADQIDGLNDGDPVTTWPDKSGNDNDAVSTGNPPTYKTDQYNRFPCVDFDNTNDGLTTGLSITSGNYSIVALFSRNDASPLDRVVVGGTANNFQIYTTSGLVPKVDAGTTVTLGSAKSIGDTLYLATWMRHGQDASGYLDGTRAGGHTSTIHPGTIALGADTNNSYPMAGNLVALVVVGRVLGDHERRSLENYFAAKYGATSSLAHEAFTNHTDWRGMTAILRRYERGSHELVTELAGVVDNTDFTQPGKAAFTITGADRAVLNERIPKTLVNVDEHPDATDLQAPIPVGFGKFHVAAPMIDLDESSSPGGAGFAICHHEDADGTDMDIRVDKVLFDSSILTAGLELASSWYASGGTPTRNADNQIDFADDRSQYFEDGVPVRIRYTGSDWEYTRQVGAYDSGNNRITLADDVLTSGDPDDVEVATGGYLLQDGDYTAGGADLVTATFIGTGQSGGVVIFGENKSISNPADVIEEILRNSVWGLGASIDSATFAQANTDFNDAGLGSACNYALGSDRQQRTAKAYLSQVLGMRGAWLQLGDDGEWELYVDKAPAFDPLRVFGLGDGEHNNILEVVNYNSTPLSQAVKTLKLRYSKKGRTKLNDDVASWLAATDYEFQLGYSVNSSTGSDRVETNPWLQLASNAGRVVVYRGKRLFHGDRALDFRTGFEGRNIGIGEVLDRVIYPAAAMDEQRRVVGYDRDLFRTTLRTEGYAGSIFNYSSSELVYDDGAGANTSADDKNPAELSGVPGSPQNLVLNSALDFRTGQSYTPATTAANAALIPGWIIFEGDAGSTDITSVTQVADQSWVGGQYVKIVIAGTSGTPKIRTNSNLTTSATAGGMTMVAGEPYQVSAYVFKESANPEDARGWKFKLEYFTAANSSISTEEPRIIASTETTGADDAVRWWTVVRPPATTAYAILEWIAVATGTYRLSGLSLSRIATLAGGLPRWERTWREDA